MTTATAGLTVPAIADALRARGYRMTVEREDVFVAEREVLGVRHAMRRVVGQRNDDGVTYRIGFLHARPRPALPSYEHDLLARHPQCRDLAMFARWITKQEARPFAPST